MVTLGRCRGVRRMRRMRCVRFMRCMRCVRLMLRVENTLSGKFHEQRVLFAIGHVLLPEGLVSGRSSLGKIFYFWLALGFDIGLDCISGERSCCYTNRHEELVGLHGWAPS